MQIADIRDRAKFSALVIQELKEIGVKYRKEKKGKQFDEKTSRSRLFRKHLHLLELTDVVLSNGSVVQVPQFVAEACNCISEQIEVEGLFRKAGSALRQKEIRIGLEAGLPLAKTHHVIDIANVLKSFFRELPEPLIPSYLQETLLRALLIGEKRRNAILIAILLLPPLTINTLSFFMQFLNTVSSYSELNKMPVENLAIIFTPGLMPFSDIASLRFKNHVKVVQLLMENAHDIGTVPECIAGKLHIGEALRTTPSSLGSMEALDNNKKKKRRSGSLTNMFSGLRKMVGAIGSAENLGSAPEVHKTPVCAADPDAPVPCLSKSSKKRKCTDAGGAFSAKKKKDLLAMLPTNSGGFLPNTPHTKEPKKARLSLISRRHFKNVPQTEAPAVPAVSVERRWSVVGSGWHRHKKEKKEPPAHTTTWFSPVRPKPCSVKFDFTTNERSSEERIHFTDCSGPESSMDIENNSSAETDSDYVRLPKQDYQAILNRVSAIETRMSHEIKKVRNSLSNVDELSRIVGTDSSSVSIVRDGNFGSGLEFVQNEYEHTKEETERLNSPFADNLARRLSKELKIRGDSESRIIRSPSARKIGIIRRRSRESARLMRNKTWHDSSTTSRQLKPVTPVIAYPAALPSVNCSKCSLKRGRPNTLHTGLPQQCTPVESKKTRCTLNDDFEKDLWIPGDEFINNENRFSQADHGPLTTPVAKILNPPDEVKTPMLPPKSALKKPLVPNRVLLPLDRSDQIRSISASSDEEGSDRASIVRLRAQNAGMVMAKAKLFDGLGIREKEPIKSTASKDLRQNAQLHFTPVKNKNKLEERFVVNHSKRSPAVNSKNISKSPGGIKKQQRLALVAKVPNRQLLDSMIKKDDLLIKKTSITPFENSSRKEQCTQSPRTSKKRSRHFAAVNSPRKGRKGNFPTASTKRVASKATAR